MDAVEDELAEVAEADLAVDLDVLLAVRVHEIDMIAGLFPADIDVLAQLDVALLTENDHAAVTPGAEALRREPVDADVIRRTVVAEQVGLAEILEVGLVLVCVVADRGVHDRGVGGAGIGEKLLELVRADVAQDAAELVLLVEPVRPARALAVR